MTKTDPDPTADEPVDPSDDSATAEGDAMPEFGELAERAMDPHFEQTVCDIVVRGLASDPTRLRAVRNLYGMLERYLGTWDRAWALMTLVASPAPDESESVLDLIEDLDQRANLEQIALRLAGRFGAEVQVGMDLNVRNPDDWQYVNLQTTFNLDSQTWTIGVLLRKFDQSEVAIAADPVSMLRLVNHLIGALRDLGEFTEGLGAQMDEEAVQVFNETAARLTELMAPPPVDD